MGRPRRPDFHSHLAEFRRQAGLTQQQVAEHIGISAEMVRRHERGSSMPIPCYRKRYCELFGTTEENLWVSGIPVKEKVRISPTVATASLDQIETSPLVMVQPTSVEFGDLDYLQSVRNYIKQIITLDNRFGGADLFRMSFRFFRSLQNQLGVRAYDLKLERDLYAAAGELAEVAGWLAYDAEEHNLVRQMNQESLYYSRLAGDKTIELLTLQNASMHAGSIGRPGEALHITRSVLEGNYQLSSRLRALFLTRKARALAQGGDKSALRLFSEIRSLFLDGVQDSDPSWAWWIDEGELAWHEAMAQQDLGYIDRAVTSFENAVAATSATEIRNQYLHRAYLLQSQIDAGSWNSATVNIQKLIPLSLEVSSTRAVVLLRKIIFQIETSNRRIPITLQEGVGNLSAVLDMALV